MTGVTQQARPIIVVGAGGHAAVVLAALRMLDLHVLGVVDKVAIPGGKGPYGVAQLGDDDAVMRYGPSEILLANGIGSVSPSTARRDAGERFAAKGYRFATMVHPRAWVADGAALEEGVQVMAGAIIQPRVHIGIGTIINTGACVDHDCQIGNWVHVAPGATLCGGVEVGSGAHIGAGAVVIQSIRIGENAVVGAGAIVVRDVPAATTVVSPRAQPMGERP